MTEGPTRRPMWFGAVLIGLLAIALSATAAAADSRPTPVLRIETPEPLVQGGEFEVVAVLHDRSRRPVSGAPIHLFERITLFGYVDTVPVGDARTDYRGRATLRYAPTIAGEGQLTAEFAGDERFAPAKESQAILIEAGLLATESETRAPTEPFLPRGVTALWFVVLLTGVWAAIGVVVYNVVRIPADGAVHRGTATDDDDDLRAAGRAPPSGI